MKKLLCLMLSVLMLLSFSACRKADTDMLSSTPQKTVSYTSDTVSNTESDSETTTSDGKSQNEPEKVPSSPSTSSKVPQTSVGSVTSSTSETSVNSSAPSVPINSQTVTNTFGNQQLVGTTSPKLIAIQGNYIYYPRYHDTDASKRGIFEYNKATKTERQVSKYPGDSINVVGDYLYYRGAIDYYVDNWNEPYSVGELSYKIICVNLKDASYKPLTIGGQSVACYNIVMYKDYVFYNDMSTAKQLCRISLNGANHKVLATDVDEFYIAEDSKVYYSTNSNKSIYSCSIDGGNKLEIAKSEKGLQMFTGSGENLYFAIYENLSNAFAYNIYKINEKNDSKNIVASESQIKAYTVANNILFMSTDKGLFNVSVINGNTIKIADAVESFTVYNNKLYISNSQGVFEYNLDGTEKVKL